MARGTRRRAGLTARFTAGILAVGMVSGIASTQQVLLREAAFDPAREPVPAYAPALPERDSAVESGADALGLWLVQLHGRSTTATRAALTKAGAEIVGYVPHDTHLVRAAASVLEGVRARSMVRWCGPVRPAWRMPSELRASLARGAPRDAEPFLVVLAGKATARAPFVQFVDDLGGRLLEPPHDGSVLRVELDARQVVELAHCPWVGWIERAGAPSFDASVAERSVPEPMDNARAQTGADVLEGLAGYRGQGMRGHVYEGVQTTHPDFTTTPVPLCAAAPSDHGHAVAGIVFGNGTSISLARGMLPDGECLYTDRLGCAQSRYDVYGQVVASEGLFTVASFGSIFTSIDYRAESAAVDEAIFDHDLPAAQSQGNIGFQLSRQEAWAKNVVSVGGIGHFENADPSDDSWFNSPVRASTGPSVEGRFKPDLCAFNDSVLTSDRTGADGFTSLDLNPSFNGTSAATPIVGGAMGLAIQMFTEGAFGNSVAVPGGTRFQNRPHFTTAKALVIESAQQYPFDAGSFDNRREHQGWGVPDVAALWDARARMVVIDESIPLELDDQADFVVDVSPGEPMLSMTLTWADPMAMPLAAVPQINDLDLVAIAPDGTYYRGNAGLMSGTESTPILGEGLPDDIDTVERVIVPAPMAGRWTLTVRARQLNQDARIETPLVDDVDFAFVVRGAVAVDCAVATVTRSGDGCGPSRLEYSGTFCQGSTARFDILRPAPGAPDALLVGSDTAVTSFGIPLPADLGLIGAPGCSLLVDPFWVAPATVGTTVSIPLDPALSGTGFAWQGVFYDPGLNPLGVGTTDRVTVVIP